MTTHLQRSFSTLLALLLALTTVTAPAAQAAPPALGAAQSAQETMPEGLMSAFLEASSQPFTTSADGYRARSGGLDFTLRASGLQAKGNDLTWSLALSSFGRREQMASLPQAEIAQIQSRLEYRRGALTEWYRNTALGVEQGFTIHQAPHGAGPLLLQLDLSTDLAGAPDADGRGLSFAAPDGQTLRYDHLRAWDANGTPLDASLVYAPGQVMLRVNDRGAAYPITIDPLVYLEQKVIATGAAQDHFGSSVALSGDTALVGAYGAYSNEGSAYVFIRSGTTWSLQQKLSATGGAANDYFGWSVALDGDTALVGAFSANTDRGSAYVFTRSGTTWTEQPQLTASDGEAGDSFGRSVALSGDTALVGAPFDDHDPDAAEGSVYFFTRSGTTWGSGQKVIASDDAADDHFGWAVALSGDTALVGAPDDDHSPDTEQGSAYVFTRGETTWGGEHKLIASDAGADDGFGSSVALSGDTALIGAPYDDAPESKQGSAYVFTRDETTWSQQQKLIALDGGENWFFGSAVAISGNTALVGAAGAGGQRGWAYTFTRSLGTWSQQQILSAAGGAPEDYFGHSVALDGDTALVGADCDDIGANSQQGSAYIFTYSGTTWGQQQKLTGSDGEASDAFGHSVALFGDTALVGAAADDVAANGNQGSAYVFTRDGTTWSLQQKLTASDGAADDFFGTSVALWGDTALVGADQDDVGANNQGSAYVFTRSDGTWSEQQRLIAPYGAADDRFGVSVALWGDTALVGAPTDDVTETDQGSAYVFTRDGPDWGYQANLTAWDGAADDRFGGSVALWGDTALVGAYWGSDLNLYQGSAYVFTRDGTAWSDEQKLVASDGASWDQFGVSVALSGDTALVGAYDANAHHGSAYVFTRTGTTWGDEQKLAASDGEEYDCFGYSVALSGGMALVGAPNDDVDGEIDQGSVYVFTRSGTTWTQEAHLTASDGEDGDDYGWSVALWGDTALVGAYGDDVGANDTQGSAYFYSWFKTYVPLVLRNWP